ncbi:hypothetical protein [Archaeoglobus sp.]
MEEKSRLLDKTIEKMLQTKKIDVEELLILLTPAERAVLKILAIEAKPLTISDVRNMIIDDIMEKILSPTILASPSENITLKLRWWPEVLNVEKSILVDIHAQIKNVQPKYKKRIKAVELLRKHNIIEIPAHQTIEKILNEFVAMGLVLSRQEIVGRKKLYVINPKVLKEVREAFSKE